ncbi:MAG: hypothetical protein IJ397_02670 [Lachnospiraceae bacterium]|nr:hypothetical protein [Lachnospiraceae bacterium]
MNRFFRICFLCVAGACLFLAGMWLSSYLFYQNELKGYETYPVKEDFHKWSSEESVPSVETVAVSTVDMNTEFVIVKENLVTGTSEEIVEELPSQFVGMERYELEEYYENYLKSPVLKDREEGLTDAMVVTYSPEKLVVKKVYEPLQLQEKFYLKAEENYVVVYYGDNSTVYMYTNIRMDSLPEETRAEIEGIKEIESYESLYSFLESHTS